MPGYGIPVHEDQGRDVSGQVRGKPEEIFSSYRHDHSALVYWLASSVNQGGPVAVPVQEVQLLRQPYVIVIAERDPPGGAVTRGILEVPVDAVGCVVSTVASDDDPFVSLCVTGYNLNRVVSRSVVAYDNLPGLECLCEDAFNLLFQVTCGIEGRKRNADVAVWRADGTEPIFRLCLIDLGFRSTRGCGIGHWSKVN